MTPSIFDQKNIISSWTEEINTSANELKGKTCWTPKLSLDRIVWKQSLTKICITSKLTKQGNLSKVSSRANSLYSNCLGTDLNCNMALITGPQTMPIIVRSCCKKINGIVYNVI